MQSRLTSSLRRFNRLNNRRSVASAVRGLEVLESRQFLTTTPFVLSSGTLTQNWEDASLISVNDDWSGVPSFVGYRGDATGTNAINDPRTVVTGDDTAPVVDVNANILQTSVNPTATFNTGGVAEVAITTPIATAGTNTVALQGSGTSDFPYLKAYLNTTGITGVRVKFDVIDIDPETTVTAPQQFVLQYRVGGSGDFTNVDSTYLAAAAPATPTATGTVTSLNVLLPAAAVGQSLVELRFITANATGNDQLIAIDNIEISANAGVDPDVYAISPATDSALESAGTRTYTVTRTGGAALASTIAYTFGGTATPGTDFTLPSGATVTGGTVSFAANQTTATIEIPITDDATSELTETLTITLGTPSTGSTNQTAKTSTLSILDNDGGGTINFVPATYSVSESGGTLDLIVTRVDGSAGAASATYTVTAGTASAGSDFVLANGTVSFAAGETSKTITATIVGNSVTEIDETFTVTLSAPTGVAIGTAPTATVTIIDDDSVLPTGLILNELAIDLAGTNQPFQYIELRGTPGQILRDTYILLVEGDNTNGVAGQADGLINLTNAVIGSNGLLLVRSPNGFAAESAATGIFNTSFLNTSTEVGSQSFILFYRSPSASDPLPTAGGQSPTDYDADDTGTDGVGTLEGFPTSFNQLDAIGELDGGLNDLVYGGGAFIPADFGTSVNQRAAGYLGRLENDLTPNSTAAWSYAVIVADGTITTQSKVLSPTLRSANTPSDARLTPGGFLGGVVVTPTTVVSATIKTTVTGSQTLTVVFSQDVAASLAASDFVLTNLTTGATITLTLVSATTTTAVLSFSGVTGNTAASTVLSSGNYRLRVLANQVTGVTSDLDTPLFFQTADFNRDRTTNFDDLLLLAKNFNGTGKTFATGDANYDGLVNFDDLLALAKAFNQVVNPLPAALIAAVTPTTRSRTSFGATVIA